MHSKGLLIVITGPSAVGKGTIVRALLRQATDVRFSVSVTTRPPRPGEVDGVEYFFVSDEEFDNLVVGDQLLEWAEVYGKRYGTPREQVEKATAAGQNIILDIDINGARQVRQRFSEGVFVFVVPPSVAELEARIRRRGTESEEAIAHRLAAVPGWLQEGLSYEYVLVNDRLETAVEQLRAVIIAEKCRTERQGGDLIRSLLDKGEIK